MRTFRYRLQKSLAPHLHKIGSPRKQAQCITVIPAVLDNRKMWSRFSRLAFGLFLIFCVSDVFGQQGAVASSVDTGAFNGQGKVSIASLPDAPSPVQSLFEQPANTNSHSVTPTAQQQPKRILGIMPNYRAVSAGAIPPPPNAKQAFKIATQNSFDYSSFVFVGVTSAIAEGTDAHQQLGKGMAGFGRYYWRGFVDKTDGNYWVIFILPTVFHQDERYFAKGSGGIWKRGIYSASRILITPDYHGHNSINFSELLGRGIAQGISTSYYPSQDRTADEILTKYAYALGRDAYTNVFREFWPDIATHLLHRHP